MRRSVSPRPARTIAVVLLGRALERAHDGGPDRHHAAAARACLGDGPRGRRRNLERLGERQRGVDRRIAGRAQPGRVGERRPADAAAAQREQDLPRQRPPGRRHLERPGARRVDGLHRPERKIVREVGVLDRASLFVERGPERVAVAVEAQLHQARRQRRVASHRRAERAEAEARALGELGRGRAVLGARVPVAGAEQHGGEAQRRARSGDDEPASARQPPRAAIRRTSTGRPRSSVPCSEAGRVAASLTTSRSPGASSSGSAGVRVSRSPAPSGAAGSITRRRTSSRCSG